MIRLTTILILLAASLPGGTLSFTDSFALDDQVESIWFNASGDVTIRTWGYAGGINGEGKTIARGGFDPYLALFDPTGLLIAVDDDGGAQVSADVPAPPGTGFRWDAFLFLSGLAPGQYLLALTQSNNFANGPFFADGFSRQDEGNFTGPDQGIPDGSFLDVSGSQRTNLWAVDVTGDVSEPAPEPGMFWLTGIALAVCAYHLTSSTRRFLALPSSESLDATGAYKPQPNESRRLAAILCFELSSLATLAARRRLRSRL
jgi:hypothetical protein